VAYSGTVLVGRSLARDGLDGPTALGIRFTLGACLLFGLQAARGRTVFPRSGEAARLALLGAVGYGAESSLFYLGLERGTAAAVSLLFYSYPALVTLVSVALRHAAMTGPRLAAVAASTAGVVLVVTAGGEVAISAAGAAASLGAAVAFTVYLVSSDRLVDHDEPVRNAAAISAGAAVTMLVRGLAGGGFSSPSGHWPLLLTYGVLNAGAFGLMFTALRRVGATTTAVLLTGEVFATVVLAAVFLAEPLGWVQVVGGLAIMAGGALAATTGAAVEPEAAAEPP
jgi:drug/metabolite transporter (DMT)-like permease